jgi:hypothetical protein
MEEEYLILKLSFLTILLNISLFAVSVVFRVRVPDVIFEASSEGISDADKSLPEITLPS